MSITVDRSSRSTHGLFADSIPGRGIHRPTPDDDHKGRAASVAKDHRAALTPRPTVRRSPGGLVRFSRMTPEGWPPTYEHGLDATDLEPA